MRNETDAAAQKKRTRGRPVGSVNRRSQMARDIMERLNCDPLEALLRIVKNRRLSIEIRLDAAKAAAPFCHARLSTTFVNARVENRFDVTEIQRLASNDPKVFEAMELLSLKLSETARNDGIKQIPAADRATVIDISRENTRELPLLRVDEEDDSL